VEGLRQDFESTMFITNIESIFSEEVDEELGMTTSQAISIFLKQVELNQGLPFDIKLPSNPNKLTQKTLSE
jgi:DNA-damage-inducible protein J